MSYVIRYRLGSDLGRRFTGHSAPYSDREQAERLRLACLNAEAMEVIEVDEPVAPEAVTGR